MKRESIKPTFGVDQCALDILPCERFILCRIAVRLEPGVDETPFVIRQEGSSCRVVADEVVCSQGHHNRQQPLDDENPSPSVQAPNSLHEPNPIGQDATESPSKRGCTEKQSNPVLPLGPLVPHAQIKHHPREQPTLRHAQHESDDIKPRQILRHAHQSRDHPPRERQRGQPYLWRRTLQNDVARDFEEHIANEVEGQAGKVLIAAHVQVVD